MAAESPEALTVPTSQTQVLPAEDGGSQSCVKCGQTTDVTDGVMRGYGVQCRDCTNIYQMLYRHLGGLPSTLQSMTAEEQMSFFKASSDMVKTCPKNGRWALVKSNLIASMTRFKTNQVKTTVRREFLPLRVWATRGFDVEKIKQHGQKQTDAVTCPFIDCCSAFVRVVISSVNYFVTVIYLAVCPLQIFEFWSKDLCRIAKQSSSKPL